MKVRVLISFTTGLKDVEGWLAVRDILATAGCTDMPQNEVGSILSGYFSARFDEDSPRLPLLRAAIEKAGLRWSEQREHLYEDEELMAAPLLAFSVTTPEKDIGPYATEQFDLATGCPICKTGAHQIAPLRVAASALPKRSLICQTIACDYLVTEPLRHALDKAGLRGLELMQVVSRKGDRLAWWQIVPQFQLPPLASATRGILRGEPQDGCHDCYRDNWFGTAKEPLEIVYRRSELGLSVLPDVASTYECFGISALEINGYLARGMTIVSRRVFDIFRGLKVKNVHFDPVRIIED